jgi:hypothetical protein
MITVTRFVRLLAMAGTTLLGCGDKDDTAPPTTLLLQDAQNYTYSASYTTEPTAVADCPEDLTVDWSGLTVDLRGQPLDPTSDLDTIRVVAFETSVEEVLADIAGSDLQQSDISGIVDHEITAGETNAEISGFNFNGTPIDPSTELCDELGRTTMVLAMSGLYDYPMFGFFVPSEGETNTTVVLTSSTTTLEVEVDLDQGGVVPAPSGDDAVVDWRCLTTDMRGDAINLSDIDQLMIGRYELSVAEMEASFLQLEHIAEELYTASTDYGVDSLDLSRATDSSGAAFTGFTGPGLWLLALSCTTCAIDPPAFIAVLEAE